MNISRYVVPIELEVVGEGVEDVERLAERFLQEAVKQVGDRSGRIRRFRLAESVDTTHIG